MSTKTLRKRIALVAVSALGTGLLTVVAPSANAANITSSSATNAVYTADTLNVAVAQSTSGASAISMNGTTMTGLKSYGLSYKDASSSTAQTATMLANGSLVLYAKQGSTDIALSASGGAFSAATTHNGTTAATINSKGTGAYLAYSSSATDIAIKWTPSVVGTYTLSLYKAAGDGALTVNTPTSGTLTGQVVVTVVSTSVAGTLSVADSTCVLRSSAATGTSDESGSSSVSNGGNRWIYYSLVDAYGDALSSSGGALTVSATGDAVVNLGSTIAGSIVSTTVGTGSTSVSGYVTIGQKTANAPVTTTVTVSYNGTVICSKTVTIAGEASKLVVTTKARQDLTGTSWTSATYGVSGGIFWAQLFDSAGNLVTPSATSAFSSVSSTLGSFVSAASISTAATGVATTDSTGLWPSVNSLGTVTCGLNAGTQAGLKMTYQNASGTTVTSNAFDVACADNPVTYTASFDKATYNPGDIAVLTVKFFDSKGNIATGLTTGTTATITTGSALTAVTSPSNAQRPALDGTLTYKYNVGSTTGAFNATIDYPTLTAGIATVQIVPFKVADATASITNAEVLAAIVKLIASINKQITALQKLLAKKK